MPSATDRVSLDRLAQLAGVDTDEHAYRLLRLGRGSGRPESAVDARRVAVVSVLARLETIMAADHRYLEAAARLLHTADTIAGLVGMPRALVVPVETSGTPARKLPPPVLSTRANVGQLIAGRAGFVVDLGQIATDWRP